jgi:hypothetical protein
MSGTIALGFRVKSGYAIGVALRGPATAPTAVSRHTVELSDPDLVETRQPFHHGFYTHEVDERQVAKRVGIVERCAKRSIAALLEGEQLGGYRCRGARLVVGSVIDPAKVGNPHIRAHASEGQLFRSVLESALRSHGIDCGVIVEKQLKAQVAAGLKRADADIRNVIAGFGRALGGPWRADEKAASAAAWLALK